MWKFVNGELIVFKYTAEINLLSISEFRKSVCAGNRFSVNLLT